MNTHACVACGDKRVAGSGFCKTHKAAHSKSLWVKVWRGYQKDVTRLGIKEAAWSPPKALDTP